MVFIISSFLRGMSPECLTLDLFILLWIANYHNIEISTKSCIALNCIVTLNCQYMLSDKKYYEATLYFYY